MNTTTTLPTAPRRGWARNAWLLAGGLALAAVGLAAGLAWHPAAQTELLAPNSMEATRASLASNEAVVEPSTKAGDTAAKPSTEGTPVPAVPSTQKPAGAKAPTHHAAAQTHATTPLATQPVAAVCTHCGVVEGVREVNVKGQGTGLGVVAGGVLGGAVGNKMGKGGGRTAMTVLGAIGGGLAGNEIEKRARSEVVYDVRVRMDDGSMRTFQQKTAPAPGSRVTVDGNTLHTTTRSNNGDGQMVRTSTGA